MDTRVTRGALILAPLGRDAQIAASMLHEAQVGSIICSDIDALVRNLSDDIAFVLVTEEAMFGRDLRSIAAWIDAQPEWSDMPFVLLTNKGGGLERNPEAGRLLATLGNVTFLERPFHPTTLLSLARAALRARGRQYDARARLIDLQKSQARLEIANQTLEVRVDERTRAHELALAKLHQAQKLETLGQLTGGVAHDFNNLLTPVIGNLDLLRRHLPDDEKAQRLIGSGLQAASRAATLVQRLLAFARRQDLQTQSVDIGELLDGMSDLIRRSLDPLIEVTVRHEMKLPPARVDPNQLELAILNLAINARDAMHGSGCLDIFATAIAVEDDATLNAGNYVRIALADTGSGMDPKTLERAVEPFFSTKGVGKGTGLGLSMVHGLAAQLGGKLEITSEQGKGTTATIWLPVADVAAVREQSGPKSLVTAPRRASILLVDDEELVRDATADMLRDLGYDVLTASSGAEALRMLRGNEQPDMLVTDYLMPDMNGVDLIAEVQQRAPSMRVLLISGYSAIDEGPASLLPRLAKPFRHADLAETVAEILSGASGRIVPLRRNAVRSPA